MAIIIVPILYFGGIIYDLAVGALAIICYHELLNVKKDINIPNIMKIIGLIAVLLLTFININNNSLIFGLNYETLALVFLILLGPTIFLTKYRYTINDAFYLSAIAIFLGTVFNLFIMLYNDSALHFIYCLIVACATDIFALCGGVLIGRHKLTKISPNKTIEGSIVGTLVSTIIGVTYFMTFINDEHLLRIIIVTIILSVIGQIGDIFFSLIKRENDVKDYSELIPGHGGLLDRLDSIIFIVIAFTYMMKFL